MWAVEADIPKATLARVIGFGEYIAEFGIKMDRAFMKHAGRKTLAAPFSSR